MRRYLLPDTWVSWKMAEQVTAMVEGSYEVQLHDDWPAFKVLDAILRLKVEDEGAPFGWAWSHLVDFFRLNFDEYAEDVLDAAEPEVRLKLYRRWLDGQPGRPH